MIVVETERLILRQFRSSDCEAMLGVFSDPEVMRYSSGVRDVDWVRKSLARYEEKYDEGTEIAPWAVTRKGNDEAIGYCGLFYYEDVGGQPETEIGYRLVRQAWGKGLATEAVCGVRDYGFQHVGLERLIAMIDPGNVASIRVAEKAGMRYWKEVMMEGYTHADHVYLIEREN